MAVIGAHVDQSDPIAQARERGADAAQIFLGDPQGWKGPEVRYPGGAQALKEAAAEAGITLVVHAPYVRNVATTNNGIRLRSRDRQSVEQGASGQQRSRDGMREHKETEA